MTKTKEELKFFNRASLVLMLVVVAAASLLLTIGIVGTGIEAGISVLVLTLAGIVMGGLGLLAIGGMVKVLVRYW